MTEEDVRQTMARIEGMLSATLPQHAARLDEHDRGIARTSDALVQHGERIASLESITAERATQAAEKAAASRSVSPAVQVVGVILAAAAIVVTVLLFAFEH